jgi:5'-3' exonuclease
MGISDFYKVINDECSHVLVKMHLSQLAGQRIAVDISIFLNKFVKTAGSQRWLDSFIMLLCILKKHGIKPVGIFDGPNPPIEKKREQDRRRAEAAKKNERIAHGKSLIKKLEKLASDDKSLDEDLIADVKGVIGARRGKNVDSINYDDIYDVIVGLKDAVSRQEKQNAPILPEYSVKAKEIIDIMGLSYFQAPGEAETLCAGLCCAGMVDAVLSEDTDVMAYGTPFMLSKIDLSSETVTVLCHEEILRSLEFDHDEFKDLCILLSCDYNDRIKGYPPDGKKRKKPAAIGAKGAFLMIKEYRRLEEAEKYIEDSDPLNYRRCRNLFTPPKKDELTHITIPYNGKIDKTRLINFIRDNKIRITMDYILSTWKPPEILFLNEGDEEIISEEVSEEVSEETHDEIQEEPEPGTFAFEMKSENNSEE